MLEPKALIGGYELIRRIGRGGMAEVWVAQRVGKGRVGKFVAVKVVDDRYVGDPRYARMFRAEAELSSLLSHANIVQAFDEGEEGGRSYLVMEWIDGVNLLKLQSVMNVIEDDDQYRYKIISYIIGQLLHALSYAHSIRTAEGNPLGIVHRDVSPQNVLISNHGEVKLTDFGVAHHILEESSGVHVKGKLRYMAPEQLGGKTRDPRVDLYAVGAILHELLDGRRFRHHIEDQRKMYLEVISGKIPSLTREVPPALDALRKGLLVPEPAQRIPSADAGLEQLERFAGYGDARRDLKQLCGTFTGIFQPRVGPGRSRMVPGAKRAILDIDDDESDEPTQSLDSRDMRPPDPAPPPRAGAPASVTNKNVIVTPPAPAPASRIPPSFASGTARPDPLVLSESRAASAIAPHATSAAAPPAAPDAPTHPPATAEPPPASNAATQPPEAAAPSPTLAPASLPPKAAAPSPNSAPASLPPKAAAPSPNSAPAPLPFKAAAPPPTSASAPLPPKAAAPHSPVTAPHQEIHTKGAQPTAASTARLLGSPQVHSDSSPVAQPKSTPSDAKGHTEVITPAQLASMGFAPAPGQDWPASGVSRTLQLPGGLRETPNGPDPAPAHDLVAPGENPESTNGTANQEPVNSAHSSPGPEPTVSTSTTPTTSASTPGPETTVLTSTTPTASTSTPGPEHAVPTPSTIPTESDSTLWPEFAVPSSTAPTESAPILGTVTSDPTDPTREISTATTLLSPASTQAEHASSRRRLFVGLSVLAVATVSSGGVVLLNSSDKPDEDPRTDDLPASSASAREQATMSDEPDPKQATSSNEPKLARAKASNIRLHAPNESLGEPAPGQATGSAKPTPALPTVRDGSDEPNAPPEATSSRPPTAPHQNSSTTVTPAPDPHAPRVSSAPNTDPPAGSTQPQKRGPRAKSKHRAKPAKASTPVHLNTRGLGTIEVLLGHTKMEVAPSSGTSQRFAVGRYRIRWRKKGSSSWSGTQRVVLPQGCELQLTIEPSGLRSRTIGTCSR